METDDMELEQIKAGVYETWAVINRAFEQIITALDKLEKRGVLKDDYVQDQSIITNDLWAKINSQIMADVGRRETDDRDHYGKMRATIERRIRGRQ
jgi:DNA-directed RNA polymerase beta subunit